MDLVEFTTQGFLSYIVVLMRVGGLFVFAPILGSAAIPAQIKVFASMVISLAVLPATALAVPAEMTLPLFLKIAAGETTVGLVIGYAAGLVFVAVQLGGMQIDQQMGMAMGRVFNPLLESQDSSVGRFYFLFAMFVYLGIGGHRILLAALVGSFKTVPVGTIALSAQTLRMVIKLFGHLFAVAFAVSAPMVLALFLTTVALGFLARTVPQMNILIIGFPVRIVVGLTVMIFTLPAIGQFLAKTMGAILGGLPALAAG